MLTHSLGALWKARRLAGELSRRTLEQRFKGSVLGLAWLVVTPAILIGIYVFVFAVLLPNPFEGAGQAGHIASLVLGLTLFNFVVEPLNSAPGVVVRHPSYVKKVRFPLELLNIAELSASGIQFLACFVLLLGFLAWHGIKLTLLAFWLVPLLACGLFMTFGASLVLAALGMYFRDLEQMTQHFTRIMMYTGAIFYPVAKIPAGLWAFLRFNPLIHLVEQSRRVLLWAQPPDPAAMAYLALMSVGLTVLGLWLFQSLRESFADLI